jgi:polysaccharide export outer membrane protein
MRRMFQAQLVDGAARAAARASLLAAVVLLVACAGRGHEGRTVSAPRAVPVNDTVGPGDLFDVRVFQEPDLTGTHRVGPDGTIDFPLVGRVQVGGRSTAEIAALLTERLLAFLQRPQVSILLKEVHSKRVIVYGQVQRPGTFPYAGPMTLSQAISLAGGFTAMAAREKVRIQRASGDQRQVVEIDMNAIADGRAPNQLVAPGDEVFVPERIF